MDIREAIGVFENCSENFAEVQLATKTLIEFAKTKIADDSRKEDGGIRVKVSGGYICAKECPDSDYPGICMYYEVGDTSDIIDLALAEVPVRQINNEENKDISLYTYANVYSEDFTSKDTLKYKDILDALGENVRRQKGC